MLVYWLLFALFAAGVLLTPERTVTPSDRSTPFLAFAMLVVALLIGLRFQVGGDWLAYVRYFAYARYASFGELMTLGEPGYHFIEWSVQRLNGALWHVNLICGLIFAYGLLRFVKVQPDPWLAALIAIPYLVVVVAMGYSRQGVAIGIMLAGLASFERRGSIVAYAFYIAFACLFHKTAVVAFPLVALATKRNRFVNVLVAIAISYLLYTTFLSNSVDQYVTSYIRAEYSSQGAGVRVVMNLVPAVLFLMVSRKLGFTEEQRLLWRNFAYVAVAMMVWLLLAISTTALDRLALYVIPLQLAVLPRAATLFMPQGLGRLTVSVYCFAVMFTWLNYAVHAEAWVPYRFFPV